MKTAINCTAYAYLQANGVRVGAISHNLVRNQHETQNIPDIIRR